MTLRVLKIIKFHNARNFCGMNTLNNHVLFTTCGWETVSHYAAIGAWALGRTRLSGGHRREPL